MYDSIASDSWYRGATALFTAPFLLAVGTGGVLQALPYEATGKLALIDVVSDARSAESASFHERLAKLQSMYQLGTDQLAAIMQVSRVAIYNWRGRRVEQVRLENRDRLGALERLLHSAIPEQYAAELGRFLRQRLDVESEEAFNVLVGDDLTSDRAIARMSSLTNRLRGAQRSRELEALLGR